MTIDHTGAHIHAQQMPSVRAWYEATLSPLGYKVLFTEGDGVIGFSDGDNTCDWWLIAEDEEQNPFHYAFRAKDHATVDAFHAAGLQAGGACNGPPGMRPHFGPHYYAAFVKDPVGNNIEAVCRVPGET